MFDVVVIGGGLSGITAALVAKERGAKVALATRSYGATALSTGAIDIAYTPALASTQESRTIAEHMMDIVAHRPRHPYGVMGLERSLHGVQAGYDTIAEALRDEGLPLAGLRLDADNRGFASSLGAVLPAALALPSHMGLDLTKPVNGPWGVVQLLGDTSFNAGRVARGLAHDAKAWTEQTPDFVVVPVEAAGHLPPMILARRFDDAQHLDALAKELLPASQGKKGLIVPPVVGIVRHRLMLERLSHALGIPVVEALAHTPSVPGLRLMQTLEAVLKRADIELVGEVGRAVTTGQRVEGVETTDKLLIRGGSYILATGRYIAGGVIWNEAAGEGAKESNFGLPVVSELGLVEEDSPESVVQKTPVESHPLLTAGVQVDAELRPINEGRVAYRNLFAAGMVIGGFASRYVLCADGVALASGFWAALGATNK